MYVPTGPRAMQGSWRTRPGQAQQRRSSSQQSIPNQQTIPVNIGKFRFSSSTTGKDDTFQQRQQQQHGWTREQEHPLPRQNLINQRDAAWQTNERKERECEQQKRPEGSGSEDPFSSSPLRDFISLPDTDEDEEEHDDPDGVDLFVNNHLPPMFGPSFLLQSFPFYYHHPVNNSRPEPDLSHMSQSHIKTKPTYQFARPALSELAEALGYTVKCISNDIRALVLADAFALIQEVAPRVDEIDPPKNTRPDEIVSWLRRIVPKRIKKFYNCNTGNTDEGLVMRAAAMYIQELRKDKNVDQVTESLQAKHIEAYKVGGIQVYNVADTLDKLEAWCDDQLKDETGESPQA